MVRYYLLLVRTFNYKKTMNPIQKPVYRIFPLRLDGDLVQKLNEMSNKTHITKTELSRIAITKFIKELEDSGVTKTLMNLCDN